MLLGLECGRLEKDEGIKGAMRHATERADVAEDRLRTIQKELQQAESSYSEMEVVMQAMISESRVRAERQLQQLQQQQEGVMADKSLHWQAQQQELEARLTSTMASLIMLKQRTCGWALKRLGLILLQYGDPRKRLWTMMKSRWQAEKRCEVLSPVSEKLRQCIMIKMQTVASQNRQRSVLALWFRGLEVERAQRRLAQRVVVAQHISLWRMNMAQDAVWILQVLIFHVCTMVCIAGIPNFTENTTRPM